MKNCDVFFDISKVFGKVRQYGLLFKLKNHNFEKFIIIWIAELY